MTFNDGVDVGRNRTRAQFFNFISMGDDDAPHGKHQRNKGKKKQKEFFRFFKLKNFSGFELARNKKTVNQAQRQNQISSVMQNSPDAAIHIFDVD